MADQLQQSLLGYNPEVSDITRQREMAKLLLQQGLTPKQGQMISGRFVGTHPLENIADLYSVYKGSKLNKEADLKQQQLAELLRNETLQDINKYQEALQGKQATPNIVPEGQTLRDDQGQLTYGSTAGTQAVAPNANKALAIALASRSPMVQGLGTQMLGEMMKPQKLGEGEQFVKFDPSTNRYETVAQGPEKYHPPITVDTGTSTILLDPKTKQPIATYGKATAGHVQETDNGLFLVDPRTGVSKPITDQKGQLLAAGKPLTESQSNATAFGVRAKESNMILKGLEDKGYRTGGVIKGAGAGIPLIGGALERGLNWTASDEQQATSQARKNFVTAVLRKESGASISPTEFENEEKKYFPQVGDSDATVIQKQKARETAIKALELQAGPGAKRIQEHNPDLNVIAPSAVAKSNKTGGADYRYNPQTGQLERAK